MYAWKERQSISEAYGKVMTNEAMSWKEFKDGCKRVGNAFKDEPETMVSKEVRDAKTNATIAKPLADKVVPQPQKKEDEVKKEGVKDEKVNEGIMPYVPTKKNMDDYDAIGNIAGIAGIDQLNGSLDNYFGSRRNGSIDAKDMTDFDRKTAEDEMLERDPVSNDRTSRNGLLSERISKISSEIDSIYSEIDEIMQTQVYNDGVDLISKPMQRKLEEGRNYLMAAYAKISSVKPFVPKSAKRI